MVKRLLNIDANAPDAVTIFNVGRKTPMNIDADNPDAVTIFNVITESSQQFPNRVSF